MGLREFFLARYRPHQQVTVKVAPRTPDQWVGELLSKGTQQKALEKQWKKNGRIAASLIIPLALAPKLKEGLLSSENPRV